MQIDRLLLMLNTLALYTRIRMTRHRDRTISAIHLYDSFIDNDNDDDSYDSIVHS